LTPDTIDHLRKLHPVATESMGDLPDDAFAIGVVDAQQLDRILHHRVHNGSTPGRSGMTGSHLVAAWDAASPDGRLGFQLLIRDICNGVFVGEVKQRLLASVLIPLSKANGGVRPIAVAETLLRTASFYMMSLLEDDMAAFFPRIQFGVELAGGSEAAAHLTRAELAHAGSKCADIIALKIDFRNAFNAILRRRVWAALRSHPKAAVLLRAFHWQYSDPSSLLVFDRSGHRFAELLSTEGVRQGCPFAAFAFALTVQSLYEAALDQTRIPNSCHGFSIQDDFTIVGPYDEVMRVYDYLEQHAHVDLGLELVTAKCQVFLPPTTTTAVEVVDAIHTACADRGLAHDTRMESLGVMFGPHAEIVAHVDSAVDDSAHFFRCLTHPSMHVQTASLLLRSCALPKLSYLTRTTHPDLLLAPARRFDQMALDALKTILHLHGADTFTRLESQTSDPDCHIHDPMTDGFDGTDATPPSGSQPRTSTSRLTYCCCCCCCCSCCSSSGSMITSVNVSLCTITGIQRLQRYHCHPGGLSDDVAAASQRLPSSPARGAN
ncbi:MAG: reverse transcriptase domain-containing protein, partial [Candidatus Pacebacteria bacterium]|nr:reverse transcriptase domain-containing protein [Candidatus Paceibacterota bacterium]